MTKLGGNNANSIRRFAAKPLRITYTSAHLSANPPPGSQFPINIRCRGQRVTPTEGDNYECRRPRKEVQVYLRDMQVGFGRGRRVNSQRFGNIAQNTRPFLRGPQPSEKIQHLPGPLLPLAPIFATRHGSSWKRTEKQKKNENPA